jgi:hypothetical protein
MEARAASTQPISTPNYNDNMTFLIILLKEDVKLPWLWNKYKANSGQWSWYLARCARKEDITT